MRKSVRRRKREPLPPAPRAPLRRDELLDAVASDRVFVLTGEAARELLSMPRVERPAASGLAMIPPANSVGFVEVKLPGMETMVVLNPPSSRRRPIDYRPAHEVLASAVELWVGPTLIQPASGKTIKDGLP